MQTANIAEVKDHLSRFLALVEQGEEVAICKRNVPVARIIPVPAKKCNRTVLGCDPGSVQINGDITAPAMPEADWHMHVDGEP
jgi:prevent-host-death family protein